MKTPTKKQVNAEIMSSIYSQYLLKTIKHYYHENRTAKLH
jgi:hypothetical protein